MNEGEKFLVSSWFMLDQKEMNRQQRRGKNLKFQRMKWGPNGNKWTSLGWTKTGSGSISGTHPGVHVAWTMLALNPITQLPPSPIYLQPITILHHLFPQSSCVNPGVVVPLACGLTATEADAGICGQNSLWNSLRMHARTHTRSNEHTFPPSLCSYLRSLSFHLYIMP